MILCSILYPNPTLKQMKNKPKSKNQGSTIKMKPGCNSTFNQTSKYVKFYQELWLITHVAMKG